MKPPWWPGEQHEQFTQWALSQGIEANGVSPARFPGRGLGMIATRNIKEEEILVTVPLQAMFTINSIPDSFAHKFESTKILSIHGLLAAFFTHGDPEDLERYGLWMKSWPTREDFEASMPLLFPRNLRASNSEYDGDIDSSQTVFLPPCISGRWNTLRDSGPKQGQQDAYDTYHQNLLAQQEKRLRNAWDAVLTVFPETDWETYSYYWLIVNTRCFYFVMPGEEPPEDRNDALALLPFADYFNHSDVACDVQFDGEKYTFRAAKSYEEGEEIFMSYGPHPNDFLFAEYGFFLDENESEVLYLDDIIFRDLKPSDRDELKRNEYYGNYQITATGACYRTEMVACIKYMMRRDWRNYILGRSMKGFNAAKSESIIHTWVRAYIKEADTTIVALEKALASTQENSDDGKIAMLLKRWKQIRDLCFQALEAVSG